MSVPQHAGRTARRIAATFVLASLVSGCALLRKEPPEAAPPPPPAVRLEVDAPDELKQLLETHLDLGRLGVLAPGEPIAEPELARLINAAPAQARSLLETEGYFNPEITVERPSEPADLVRMHVNPGPRVRIDDVRIEVRGPLVDDMAGGEAQAYAQAAQRDLRRTWGLPTGSWFRNREWVTAKNGALARLRAHGYLAASWVRTQARIDAANQHAQLELVADSGPLFRTGELRIRGTQNQDEAVIRNLAGFGPGTPATEQMLLDYQERLQKSGLFERATVVVADDVKDAGAARVTVRVAEQQLKQATVGVGFSANVGARVSLEHVNRNLLGWNANLYNKLEVAELRQAWEGQLTGHPGPRYWRNLLGWTYERVESDTDTVTSARARVGRTKDTRLVDRLYFLEYENSLRRVFVDDHREQTDALSLNYQLVWRRLDSVVLPTEGYSVSLQTSGGYAKSNFSASDPRLPADNQGPYARAWARVIGYWPVGSWFSSVRLELGQVFVRDSVTVPDSQRFRAGGDESVRGYAYRSLGPVINGAVTSGNMVFTTSAEIARPILQRLPSLWGAAFIDAGRAANRWSDLKPAIGYGVGLRFRSPIGPLRADVAYGEEVDDVRLHVSVGVTF